MDPNYKPIIQCGKQILCTTCPKAPACKVKADAFLAQTDKTKQETKIVYLDAEAKREPRVVEAKAGVKAGTGRTPGNRK